MNWVNLLCMNRIIKKGLCYATILGLVLVVACSPQKKIRKYSHLFHHKKEDPKPVTTTIPKNTTTSPEASNLTVSERILKVIKEAETYLGVPYRYGGTSRSGLDCSALTMNSYLTIEIILPRSSIEQSRIGTDIKREMIQPGDLIFFDAKLSGKITHVGMCTSIEKDKGPRFIHATTSYGVRYDLLNSDYWSPRFVKSVRVVVPS